MTYKRLAGFKTTNAAINALLQAKILDCEKRNIKIELKVTSQLDGFQVPSWNVPYTW